MKNLAPLAFLSVASVIVSCAPGFAQTTKAAGDRLTVKGRMRSVVNLRVKGQFVMGPIFDFSYYPKKCLTDLELYRLITRRSAFQGFNVVADSGKTFDHVDDATSERIVRDISQLNFVPFERIQHFNWCNDGETIINGWCGVVTEIVPVEAGWKVTVATCPSFYRYGTRILFTHDRVEESYVIEKSGRLNFISAVAQCSQSHGRLFEL